MTKWSSGDSLNSGNLNLRRPSWSSTFPFFDAREFGATGDGTTDDTAAINSALSAAAGSVRGALPSAWVFLSAGSYRITSTLTLYRKCGLVGVGPRGTSIQAGSGFTGVAMIANDISTLPATAQQHAYVQGLELLGNNVSGTNGIYFNGPGQISYIRDVEVNNVNGYGIQITSSSTQFSAIGVLLENLSITSTGNHCIILGPKARACIVRNIAGQTMPPGYSSVYIDGSNDSSFGQTANNFINEVHHESTAHSSYGVSVHSSVDNVLINIQSTAFNSTDTLVFFGPATYRNVAMAVRPGGSNNFCAIQDDKSGITIIRHIVPLYTQSEQSNNQHGGDVWLGNVYARQGTALSPTYSWSSENSLGLYRSANSTIALSYGKLVLPSGSTINLAEAAAASALAGDATGTTGDVAWGCASGTTFLYVCVSTNSWMRAALSPF